jgi:Asp-tRNA(Asn)/Glu-tRNA(Gln) amidotransferase B subunit
LTKEGSLVPAGGSLLASADAIKGAAARPAEVGASPAAIVSAFGLGQISDEAAIRRAVEEAVSGNPKQLEQYRGGKDSLFGFFVGQVMKATGGRANPPRQASR